MTERRTASLARVAIALILLAPGCATRLFRGKQNTISCSCGAAGCSCPHCMGEADRCGCRAADAYGQEGVGAPR